VNRYFRQCLKWRLFSGYMSPAVWRPTFLMSFLKSRIRSPLLKFLNLRLLTYYLRFDTRIYECWSDRECLFSKENLKFDVYISVHCEYISKYNQQDATFFRSIYFYKLLFLFQAVPPPIISSTKLYTQRQVLSKQYCCLLLSWRRWNSVPVSFSPERFTGSNSEKDQ
jgi:hypothetical protein